MSIFGKQKKQKSIESDRHEITALPPAATSLISEGTKIIGEIHTSDQIKIDGRLEGELHASNHTVVGAKGVVKANLEVKSLQVYGRVIGDVVSQERVTIERSGTIEGNITAPKLAISEGALFKGNIDMSQRFNKDSGKEFQKTVVENAD